MEEPGWLLRAVTEHFAGGSALWIGWVLLLVAIRAQTAQWSAGKVSVFAALGLVWVVLSGWPSFVIQGLLYGTALIWLMRPVLPSATRLPDVRWWRRGVLPVVVVALLFELPWTLGPLRTLPVRELAVIGDSVTAGLNAKDVTWPRVLAQTGAVPIWDASQQGATVASARQQLQRLDGRGDALLIEIGGNDLLEGLPVDDFAARLDALLDAARPQYASVTMLELPLPPLCNRYGVVQRRLATKHGVALIPKRVFARVLTATGSTVDGIHLSDRGQQRMASAIREWLQLPATPDESEYHRLDVVRPASREE
jgi:acyl-CoA thioesterase-1